LIKFNNKKAKMKAHTFKVSLYYSKRIYRQIACLGNQSLDDLHEAIFSAFDRDDEHLYSFYFPTKPTKNIRLIRTSAQYSHPMALSGESYYEQHDASDVTIESLDLFEKQKFYYLFDYGDQWWHEITYEGINDCTAKKYPAILLKKGKSPEQYPEDDEYE